MAKKGILGKLGSASEEGLSEEGKLRKELLELRIQHSSGQLKETHKIKGVRRSIARLKTLNREVK